MATAYAPVAPSFSVSRLAGIAFLLTAKGMDVATTASVLLAHPGAEVNPVAATVVGWAGVVGLVFLGAALCLVIIGVTELAADRVRDELVGGAVLVRLVGYAPPILIWSLATVHNVRVISGALA